MIVNIYIIAIQAQKVAKTLLILSIYVLFDNKKVKITFELGVSQLCRNHSIEGFFNFNDLPNQLSFLNFN